MSKVTRIGNVLTVKVNSKDLGADMLYVLEEGIGKVSKVGITRRGAAARQRFETIRCGNPNELSLACTATSGNIGVVAVSEAIVQDYCRRYLIRGSWYSLEGWRLNQLIALVVQQVEESIYFDAAQNAFVVTVRITENWWPLRADSAAPLMWHGQRKEG